jgi:hypothetical protein
LIFQASVVRLAIAEVEKLCDLVLASALNEPFPRTRNDQKFHGSSSGVAAAFPVSPVR